MPGPGFVSTPPVTFPGANTDDRIARKLPAIITDPVFKKYNMKDQAFLYLETFMKLFHRKLCNNSKSERVSKILT
jgi:hypothetical protein